MQVNKIRIALIHIHGLLRGHDLELGRDADTGGQTKYVLELAKALSDRDDVEEVTIFTRLIPDKKVSADYANPVEYINDTLKIVRIQCGPRRYLKKESLWDYLFNFADKTLNYIKKSGKIPHVIHGHYADGGLVGSKLANLLNIPFIFTGHSLGRVKQQRLVDSGKDLTKILAKYRLVRRIEAEEFALDNASMVVTSTQQEVQEQYSIYEQYQPANMTVIAPGVDLEKFHPVSTTNFIPLLQRLNIILENPNKPIILAIARPDERKNLTTLIRVYGESKDLQELANLVIIAGSREKIDALENGQKKVLYAIFKLVDDYNLYGKIAYPKKHTADDIPQLYQWAMMQKGVFVNPAFTEPFGLTLIESSATGLPIVATNDGGPRDILANCNSGLLIDPFDNKDIERKLLRLLTDHTLWNNCSSAGIQNTKKNYSWQRHCNAYMEQVLDILHGMKPERFINIKPKKELPHIDRLVITDIDDIVTKDTHSIEEYNDIVNNSPDTVGFGLSTGRSKESALKVLEQHTIVKPQLLIASVGTEIYYGEKLIKDDSWTRRIGYKSWEPEKIKAALEDMPGLKLQNEEYQTKFKISYIIDTSILKKKSAIKKVLRTNKIKARVIFSRDCFLDIIPLRSGEGLALRHVSFKWGIPLDKILIAGNSGNDETMLKGETLGVVVGNYSKELEKLKSFPRVYFAQKEYVQGLIEGIKYYNFFDNIQIPNNFYDK